MSASFKTCQISVLFFNICYILQDWNLLLERIANLELCIIPEDNSNKATTTATNSSAEEEESVTALLGVAKEVHSLIHNNTLISGSLAASLLGLRGNLL